LKPRLRLLCIALASAVLMGLGAIAAPTVADVIEHDSYIAAHRGCR